MTARTAPAAHPGTAPHRRPRLRHSAPAAPYQPRHRADGPAACVGPEPGRAGMTPPAQLLPQPRHRASTRLVRRLLPLLRDTGSPLRPSDLLFAILALGTLALYGMVIGGLLNAPFGS